eukprot:TRINITY_DN22351_c0_g1_i1.p2 TRINITY_DN22351_c0_g1~~TRINITY_DN22351_c0_g1_i1.p2  ORF type:complete len:333 (+),score=60.70 TRINITY_DN22351_c0_g1_i1:111-1001(+)
MITVTVVSRSNRSLGEFSLADNATLGDLKQLFREKNRVQAERQYFTADGGKVKLDDRRKRLAEYGIKNGDQLVFKDLGPQVGWTTVFLTEYTGPILIYLFFYMRPAFVYGAGAAAKPYQFVQQLAAACWIAHYVKRDLETLFVHRFSNDSMPWTNIFKNSMYYWGAGALVGYFVNHPLFTAPVSETQIWAGAFLMLVSELSNFITHIQLRNLRPAGTSTRQIPRGFLFELVSCPNYFAEVMSWVGFSLMTQTVAAVLFTLVGFAQMYAWAVKKHKRYHAEFPTYPKSRTAMIPFFL